MEFWSHTFWWFWVSNSASSNCRFSFYFCLDFGMTCNFFWWSNLGKRSYHKQALNNVVVKCSGKGKLSKDPWLGLRVSVSLYFWVNFISVSLSFLFFFFPTCLGGIDCLEWARARIILSPIWKAKADWRQGILHPLGQLGSDNILSG